MKLFIIPKYKADVIANALRLTANIYGCRNKKYETEDDGTGRKIGAESAWDREVILAEKYVNEILVEGQEIDVERKELTDAIENLMGIINNPIAKRKLASPFLDEAISSAEETLKKYKGQ